MAEIKNFRTLIFAMSREEENQIRPYTWFTKYMSIFNWYDAIAPTGKMIMV